MRRPHCCPVCNDLAIETILQNYDVTAKVRGEEWVVNALAPFLCANGHVFFLCRKDLVPATIPEIVEEMRARATGK